MYIIQLETCRNNLVTYINIIAGLKITPIISNLYYIKSGLETLSYNNFLIKLTNFFANLTIIRIKKLLLFL